MPATINDMALSHHLTEEQWQTIAVCAFVTTTLSIVCAVITIYTYLCYKKFRTGVAGLICLMACSELVSMIGYGIGRYGIRAGEESVLCQLQAVLQQIGDLSTTLWTGCIAMDLLLVMLFHCSVPSVRRLHFRVYAPICITISLLIGLVPLALRDNNGLLFYGESGPWCWISHRNNQYQFYLSFLILWCIFFFNVGVYVAVGRLIWRHSRISAHYLRANEQAAQYQHIYVRNASIYLLVFLLAWTVPFANRLYLYLYPDRHIFALYLLHAMLVTLNGVFNCIGYFYIAWISGVLSLSRRGHRKGDSHRTVTPARLPPPMLAADDLAPSHSAKGDTLGWLEKQPSGACLTGVSTSPPPSILRTMPSPLSTPAIPPPAAVLYTPNQRCPPSTSYGTSHPAHYTSDRRPSSHGGRIDRTTQSDSAHSPRL